MRSLSTSAPVADTHAVAVRLERYVAIDSPNPGLEPGTGEAEMADLLAADLAALGARVVRQEALPGRSNVIGHFDVGADLPTIVLDAHVDTVPRGEAGGPRWQGQTLFGRGACDNKGSLAAMVEAARLWCGLGEERGCNLVMLGTVDEEVAVKGAEAAAEIVGRADLIVVGEPTNLSIGVWHKGTTRFAIETRGLSCHSSMPERGDNAIDRMAIVLSRINEHVRPAISAMRYQDGTACVMSLGSIAGGGPLNQVPDHCRLGIDVRRVPGFDSQAIVAAFDAALADLTADGSVQRGEPFISSRSFRTTAPQAVIDELLECARRKVPGASTIGLPFGTNANRLDRFGAPIVVAGPGHIEYAHTATEQVELAEVADAVGFYVDALCRLPPLLARAREAVPAAASAQ
jgi:acetylornithine deacetylase/succinyl-diaminopimelate desuccinylase-like protein